MVIVLIIAAVAVGQVVARLAPEPQRQVFDHDEALEFVASALPVAHSAVLSYEDTDRILRLHHDYLHEQGLARSGGDLDAGTSGAHVIDGSRAARYVRERAALVGFHPTMAQITAVITAHYAYFEAIGAATEVDAPEDPESESGPTAG